MTLFDEIGVKLSDRVCGVNLAYEKDSALTESIPARRGILFPAFSSSPFHKAIRSIQLMGFGQVNIICNGTLFRYHLPLQLNVAISTALLYTRSFLLKRCWPESPLILSLTYLHHS